MKKIILLLSFLVFIVGYSQEYEVTPNGLKDKSNLENTYLVIETPNKKASELYINAFKYINEYYKNPEKVVKSKIENEYLRFETYVSGFTEVVNTGIELTVSMKYTIELRFKDGKVKFEITNLNMTTDNGGIGVYFKGSVWKGYPIYNKKNGKLRYPKTKTDIENYFKNKVKKIKSFLLEEKTEKDNW